MSHHTCHPECLEKPFQFCNLEEKRREHSQGTRAKRSGQMAVLQPFFSS